MIKKFETMISAKGKRGFSFIGSILSAISTGYGGSVKLRETFYKKGIFQSKRLPCPVISVGNITLGGTGKTPMTIYVARLIQHLGYGVAIISRGYKGKAETKGGIVCDGQNVCMKPDQAGDEPFMLAQSLKTVPVVVGKNRFKAGTLAVKKFNTDVILLDDGFQHLGLFRDINLVLLDSARPFGNNYLFPKGTLREPISSISRGDAIILTRSNVTQTNALVKLKNFKKSVPIFQSFHVPYIYKIIHANNASHKERSRPLLKPDFHSFNGKRVFAFSGIARNDDFRRTIENLNCKITDFFEFPDHHWYLENELDEIVNSAIDLSSDCIFTTEKDYARIIHRNTWPIDIVIIGIETAFKDDAFDSFIKNRLNKIANKRI